MTQYTAPIPPSADYPDNPQYGDTYIDSSNEDEYTCVTGEESEYLPTTLYKNGYSIPASGNENVYDGWCIRSAEFDYGDAAAFTYVKTTNGGAYTRFHAYDSDGTWLGQMAISYQTAPGTYDVKFNLPASAREIRVSISQYYTITSSSLITVSPKWEMVAGDEHDVDWFGERHNEQYLYRRVSWDAWQQEISTGKSVPDEIGELTNITSGNVALSSLSDLKASCDFTFEGGEPPNPNELLRIYYTFEDSRGRSLDDSNRKQRNRPAVLGTFFPVYNDVSYEEDYQGEGGQRSLKLSGSVSGDSVLSVFFNRRLGYPMTLPAGTPTLEYVDQMVKSMGIRTNNPQYIEQGASAPSVTKWAHTFEPDDPIITVLNWCLRNTTPRYRALFPDPYGIVQIRKYVDVEGVPDPSSIVHTFTTDEYSIVQRGITSDNDWQTTPNVCRVSYTDDTVSMRAVSKNLSGSRFSLDARGGREITVQGDIEELAGDTNGELLTRLKERCEYRLKENSSEIEHTVFKHAYLGWLQPNDAVALDYVNQWAGYITNMDVSLRPSTQCQTKIRKYLPNSITYETTGEILWTA